jgi:hypothetical protein
MIEAPVCLWHHLMINLRLASSEMREAALVTDCAFPFS